MRKTISIALVFVLLLSLAGSAFAAPAELSAKKADMQISYIYANLQSFKQNTKDREWYYTVADLDHNGRLELIAASLHPSDRSTNVKVWELNVAESTFAECKVEVPAEESFPDILADSADTYYDEATDSWHYMFYDNIVLSDSDAYSVKCSVNFKDEALSFTQYAVAHTATVGIYQSTTFMDNEGATITPEMYNAAGVNAFSAAKKSSTNFDWFTISEAGTFSRLADSYAIFTGEKQPDKTTAPVATPKPTATPAPSSTPAPSQKPSLLMITKNPTNEYHKQGETAWFVANANIYDSLYWTFVSPDGGEYSAQSFLNIFGDSWFGGEYSTSLAIYNVVSGMNYWGAYCTFYYNGQTARTNTAYLYVSAPAPAPTPTPYPTYNNMGGVVTDAMMSTVTIALDNGSSVQVLRDICDLEGGLSVGNPCTVWYYGNNPTRDTIDYVFIYDRNPQPEPPAPSYGNIDGTVIDFLMSTVTISLSDGSVVQVLKDFCEVDGSLYVGAYCSVDYYGTYPSADTIYHVYIAGSTPEPDVPVYGSMAGTIYNTDSDVVTIYLADGSGVTASRYVCNAVSGEMADGCGCTVYYYNYPDYDTIYMVDVYGVYPEPDVDWDENTDWSDVVLPDLDWSELELSEFELGAE